MPLSRKASNFTLSHIRRYTGVQERSRASLGMTLRKWHFPNISFIRDVGYPSPLPSFRAQSRNLPCTLLFLAPFAKGFPFSVVSHRTIYTIPSFRAQREIFLALRRSLLLSLKVSHFPLSHIRHYPLLQERSLDFARDDNEDGALLSLFSCRHAKECLFEAH